MENSRAAEMAQGDATQTQAAAILMRTYWIQKLGLATLQAVGVSQSDLQDLSGEVNLTTVQSKLDEHRRHWVHQPTDVEENKRDAALLDARFADAGLKALEGLYAEALGICEELLNSETEHGSSSIMLKIRVEGVKGLVHALMGEWQAAHNFLVRSIMQVCTSDRNGNFFYDCVVLTFGEALGYLLTHLVEIDGSARDSLRSSAILDPCDKSHALYPVVLLGLGFLGEGTKFEVTTCKAETYMEDFARQLSRLQCEASSCLCSCAHDKIAFLLSEFKNKDEEHMIMAEGFRLAESIHLAQSTCKSTHLESSSLDGFGDSGTDPFLSLKTNSSALRSKLSVYLEAKTEIEADPEVQRFCQRLLAIISTILTREGLDVGKYPRPPADAHPTDVMVYSLCIIAFLENESVRKLEALEEVAGTVSRVQHVIKGAVWISECLSELTKEYLERRAYREAAAICLLHSNLSTTLQSKLGLRTHQAGYLYEAGELTMALEVIEAVTEALMQLDESQWRTRAVLYLSAAGFFHKGGQFDKAIGAREEACRMVCAHAASYEFTDRKVDLYLITEMILLLQSYERQRNWSAAYKLIESMDAHIDKHFRNEAAWKDWHVTKYNIALTRGDEDIAGELLELHYSFTDDSIGILSSNLFELRKMRRISQILANRGRWEKAMKETDKMLELIQNLSSPRDKHVEELGVRITRCFFYSSWGNRNHALIEEVEKVIAAVNSVEYVDVREYVRLEFAQFLCSHAVNCYVKGNVTESKRLMGLVKSKVSICNNPLELAQVEFSEALMLYHGKQWVEAAEKARPPIFLLLEEQRRLGHLDHEPVSWLSFSRDYLNRKLWFIESLYLRRLQNPILALLWAERSQQRFFMHQIYNQPKEIAIPNPSDVDECDQLLTALIFQTTKALRTKTSIIEYSYNSDEEKINMYVVAMSPNGKDLSCKVTICHLPTWFKDTDLPSNQNLQELIDDAIDDQGPSIEALSILHALLIQFIEKDLEDCDSLVFVPGHGCLAKIPFAALYDDRHKVHLISGYNVAVVPSIVTLHRCLYSQYNFERDLQVLDQILLQDSSLEPGPSEQQSVKFDGHLQSNLAFIAGNPVPMGLGLDPLPGAEEEAKTVAAFFKVTPCIGKDMTKQAVIAGLSTSKVVLLATHGVVDDDLYPHGCLVLQASPGPDEVTSRSPLQPTLEVIKLTKRLGGPDKAASTSNSTSSPGMDMVTLSKQLNDVALTSTATPAGVSSTPRLPLTELSKGKGIAEEQEQDVLQHDGHPEGKRSFQRLFEFSDRKSKQQRAEEAPQILTAEEIGALKGGISAGLVVLSACQSGLGEATTGEGLLGLGRALLLAGAISTILTLWKVDDVFTSRFIIDLFKELLVAEPRGRSVDECMKQVIQTMIRDGEPLKHWAAFTIMGSPTLRLIKPDKYTWGVSGLDKHSYHAFPNGNCLHPCRVCEKRNAVQNKSDSTTIYDVSNTVDVESMRTLEAKELEELLHMGARLEKLGETNVYKMTSSSDGSFEYLSFGKLDIVRPPWNL